MALIATRTPPEIIAKYKDMDTEELMIMINDAQEDDRHEDYHEARRALTCLQKREHMAKKRRVRMDSQEGRAYKKQCQEEQDKRRAYLYAVMTHTRSSLGEHVLRAHTSVAIADSYNEFKEKHMRQSDDLITKGLLSGSHHLPIAQEGTGRLTDEEIESLVRKHDALNELNSRQSTPTKM